MPYYDYQCDDCGAVTEIQRGMRDSDDDVVCASCGSGNMGRVFTAPHIRVRGDRRCRILHADGQRRHTDMETELREDFGVHSVTPQGQTYEETYQNIKQRGSMVKEMMKARTERTEKEQSAKSREWMKGALARTTKRGREKKERRAKEEAEKRRIILHSGSKSTSTDG